MFGVQFHPEKSSRDGLRAAAQLRAACARRSPRDPLPGDRHPRRQGRAARAGRLRRRDRLPRRPARGRARRGSRRGARFLHVVDLDGARAGEPRATSSTCARIVARDRRAGPVRRRPAHARRRCATALRGRRRARDRRHRRVPRRRLPRRGRRAAYGAARDRLGRRARRARSRPRAGRSTTEMPAGDAIERLQRPRRARVRLHRRRPRRHARRARPRRGRSASPRPCAARFLYSGGIGSLERPAARSRELRQVNLAGVIVGKALYEGRFTSPRAAALRARRATRRAEPAASGAMHYKRVIPCLDVDARPRRQGHALHRHPRRRRPGRAGRALRRARAPTSSSSSTSPRRHDKRDTVVELARRAADEVFVPFTIGGGIRAVERRPGGARRRRRQGLGQLGRGRAAGADRRAGRACSARSASCWRSTPSARGRSGWEVYVAGGRTPTGRDAVAWAREGVERGAGEILLTSMDRDGTKDGYDLELTRAVAEAVDVPVIASGGAGELDAPRRRRSTPAPTPCCARRSSTTAHHTVAEVKAHLAAAGVPVRPIA